MFTIKYRSYVLSATQNADMTAPRCFDQVEQIHGPFQLVSQEMDDGYTVVYAHRHESELGYTFGPINGPDEGPETPPRPTVWVMNDHGATVARYDL